MSKIPGFRSGKTWKKVVATIGYLFIALVIIGAINGPKSSPTTASSTASTSAPTSSSVTKTPEQLAQEKADAEKKAAEEKAAAEAKAKADAEAKAAAEQAALDSLKNNAKTIPYKNLARNPDDYKGTQVKYTGKVVQVQEDGDAVGLRVNVTKDEYGLYSDTVFVMYDKNIVKGRILEDDVISFWGTSEGLLTYKTVMGAEMTIPQIRAQIVELDS